MDNSDNTRRYTKLRGMRPLCLFLVHLLFCTQVLASPPSCYSWFGHPDPAHCEALILGATDFPGHNDGHGIDRIDGFSHAFTVVGATRDSETDEQWENRVWIPKVFGREEYPNCKIALLPFDTSQWRFSRDTSTWLAVATVGSQINHQCVRGQGLGGFEYGGDRRALSIFIFAPGSEFDAHTARGLGSGSPVAFSRWRYAFSSSDDEDQENPPRKKTRTGGGENTAWAAGPSNPGVQGLGNHWVFDYGTIHSVAPSNRAAAGLARFYESVIDTATTNLANATVESTDMVFAFGGLSLRFSSAESIEWLWIVKFLEAMATSLTRGFAVLYDQVIAENLVWDVATVLITLSAI
ncbi:MAG: hypothetical protein LQ349_002563 [Xanthoria aureola]|nr:MAG: hypothetical protein LQ349_002563 [Xanthoria aureola]